MSVVKRDVPRLSKGFGVKTQSIVKYQTYNIELKRRYLTDNSEMLIGTATLNIPKSLYDRTGQTPTKREVWDAFARACCYCLISSQVAKEKKLNQLFLFDSQWSLLDRIELNAWDEPGQRPTYEAPLDNKNISIAREALKRCDVRINWLTVPVVA
jgi:hypothetical protein